MKIQLIFSLVFALLLNFNQAKAQKIYISPTGNNNNPGTIEKPVAALQTALLKARELRKSSNSGQPVEICILKGEYFMMQPLIIGNEDSGTAESPLIIKGEEGAKVVLSGGMQIEGFEKVNDKLWRAFVPQVAYYNSYFEQLYVNGRRAVRARTPNEGFYFVKNVTETVVDKGEGQFAKLAVQKIELDSTESTCFEKFTSDDFKDAVVTFYHKWDNTRKRVISFDRKTSSVYIMGQGMRSYNQLDKKTRYYVENFKDALDSPGEWYLERSGYLYYIPKEGETIENTSFYAPVLNEFIAIHGDASGGKKVENIRFENLTFEIAAYQIPPEGNEPAQAAATVNATVTLDFADNIEFSDCEIAHTGTYAFWFRRACSNCTVNHCYIHDLGAGGIKVGEMIIRPDKNELTTNITIDNNIIRDGGHIFPCAVGVIVFNSSDNKITHNEIADFKYSGISLGWVWGYAFSPTKRNKVEFNHIHHLGWGELCDMGGVYTLGASEGTTVSNNVIHHIFSFDYGGWGLYTDEGSYAITMENNLVYACKNSGFHQHYGKDNVIRNNIFALNKKAQLQATRVEDHRSLSFTNNIVYYNEGELLANNWDKINLLTDYNCYWNVSSKDILFNDKSFSEWKASGKDIHSVIADPLFVNPEKFDFHFRNLSLAKKIKFVPFDYSQAGVYGSDEWKSLAKFDQKRAAEYEKGISKIK